MIALDLRPPCRVAPNAHLYAACWMVLCMLSLGTAPAFGHTRLLESVPPEGHVIPMGTRVVELRYSAPIQPRFSDFVLHFLGAPGETPGSAVTPDNRLAHGAVQVDATRRLVSIALPDDLPDGYYALDWMVLSDDGHRVEGSIHFQIAR